MYKVEQMLAAGWAAIMNTEFVAMVVNAYLSEGAIGILTGAVEGLNAAMMANPIGAVILLIGLLVGAFIAIPT